MFKPKILIILLLVFSLSISLVQAGQDKALLSNLHVPDGFTLSIFADNVPNARSLALGDKGIVYVGSGAEGKVYAIEDLDNDGIADKTTILAKDLSMPNGVAFKDHALYVAEVSRITRYDGISERLANPPRPVVVYDQLPSDTHHGWKYLRFGPDGKLYTAIGAPCNSCEPKKPYGSLLRLNPDGSHFEIIATGIRNTVGFDWQPNSNALFFTENGQDNLGDDVPPEELNQWTQVGEHFGYPYCHGGTIADPTFGKSKSCKDFRAPVWLFKAHNAPLGARFYRGHQFPVAYRQQLFIALHGSWNRTLPDGYRVVLLKFVNGKPESEESVISGWLTKDNKVLGRPVDLLEMPNGDLLISDDQGGLIYRLHYTSKT